MPTTRNSPGGPANRIWTVSPTLMSWPSAVNASITTSSLPCGGEPDRISNPFRSFHAEAAVGGPSVPMTFPVAGSTIWA